MLKRLTLTMLLMLPVLLTVQLIWGQFPPRLLPPSREEVADSLKNRADTTTVNAISDKLGRIYSEGPDTSGAWYCSGTSGSQISTTESVGFWILPYKGGGDLLATPADSEFVPWAYLDSLYKLKQEYIDALESWRDSLLLYMSLESDSFKVDSNLYVFGKVWIQDSLIVNTRVLFIPPIDSSAVGNIVLRQAGENLVFLNSCYLKSDGKYWKTDADASTTMPCRMVALGTINADGWGLFMDYGYIRCDALDLTIGGDVYPGVTAGELTQTQVSGTGDISQIAGYAETADVIKINPDWTKLELK